MPVLIVKVASIDFRTMTIYPTPSTYDLRASESSLN